MCIGCMYIGCKSKSYTHTPTDKFNKAFDSLTQHFKIEDEQLFYNFCTYIEIDKYHEIMDSKTLYLSLKYSLPLVLYIYDLVYHVYKIDEKKISSYYSKHGLQYKHVKNKCYDTFVKILEQSNRLIRVPSRSDLIKYYLKYYSNPLGAAGLYQTPTTMFEQYKVDFPNVPEKVVAMAYMFYYRKRILLITHVNLKLMKKLSGSLLFKKYEKLLNEQIIENYDDFEH